MKKEVVKEGCRHAMKVLGLFCLLMLMTSGSFFIEITKALVFEISHNINKYWEVSSKFTKYNLAHYSFLSSSLKDHSKGYIQPLLQYRYQRSYRFYCYTTFFKVPQDIVFNDLNWKGLTEIKGTINYKKIWHLSI